MEKWRAIFQVLIIVIAGLWVFSPTLHGDWLMDDDFYITDNPLLHDPDRLWKAWFQPGSFIEYYPVEQTVQWMQWKFWGNQTLGYHLTNVFLHILSALLVWRLLNKFGLRLSWLGGLIFAIHPTTVESVAWISELKNTLSLPPFLLAMCAYIDYGEYGKRRDYLLALGLFLVAMLCKITMAPFPVVILLYIWWKHGRIEWNDLKACLPFFVISLILGLTTIRAGSWYNQHYRQVSEINQVGDLFSRLALAGLTISFYFTKCFWPTGLLFTYPKWTVDPSSFLQLLPWPILCGIVYWFWTNRRTWGRHALLGAGFFLLNLMPFVGLMSVSYMSFTWVMDHFLYIPLIGLIGLFVAGLEHGCQKLGASIRPYGIGVIVIVMVLLAFKSHRYAKNFINEETLWNYTVQGNPMAWVAYDSLAVAVFHAGRVTQAIEYYKIALKIKPDYPEAHDGLGLALAKAGRTSEAITEFERALQICPNFSQAHTSLGTLLHQTGRISEAIEQYEQAIKINPNEATVHNNLGNVLQESGRMNEALEQFEQALKINPDYVLAHNDMGVTLAKMGRLSEAKEQFEAALQIDPNNLNARNNLTRLQKMSQ